MVLLALAPMAAEILPLSRDQISPPWMTKFGTTRLKVVVSNIPVAARFKKLRTDSGACSGKNSISIAPASVSNETHCDAIVFTSALSNGSVFTVGGIGREFVFAGSCAKTVFNKNANETKINATLQFI